MIFQVKFDGITLSHAYKRAWHSAAESPEHIVHTLGDFLLDFLHFEFDDDLGRFFSCSRWPAPPAGWWSTACTGAPWGGPKSPGVAFAAPFATNGSVPIRAATVAKSMRFMAFSLDTVDVGLALCWCVPKAVWG